MIERFRYAACMFAAFVGGMLAGWASDHGHRAASYGLAVGVGAAFFLLWPWGKDRV